MNTKAAFAYLFLFGYNTAKGAHMKHIRYALLCMITIYNLDCFGAKASAEEVGAPAHGGAGGSQSSGSVSAALEYTANSAITTIKTLATQKPKSEDYSAQLEHQRRILQTLYEPEKPIPAGQEVLRVRIYMGLYLCAAHLPVPTIRKLFPVPAERKYWLQTAFSLARSITDIGLKHKVWDAIRENSIETDRYRVVSASVIDKYGSKKA